MSEQQEQSNPEQNKVDDGCAGCGCLIIGIISIVVIIKLTGCPWWAALIILLLIFK